jgi:hypothetical protein
MPKRASTATTLRLPVYKIANETIRAKALADAILPVALRRNLLNEDTTTGPRPTLRVRVAENSFIQLFDLSQTKLSLPELELVTRDIFTTQATINPDGTQLIVIAFTDSRICLHFSFSNNLFTHEAKSWKSLLEEIGETILGYRLKDLLTETLKLQQAKSDSATRFAEVLANRDFKALLKFLSEEMGWGKFQAAPKVPEITPQGAVLFFPHEENIDSILVMPWNESLKSVAQCRAAHRALKTYTDAIAMTKEKMALQKNLWARSGIGSSPTV